MLVNGRCIHVCPMWVNKEGMIDIVSDQNMLTIECMLDGRNKVREKGRQKRWRLRNLGWENFQVDLNEKNWECGGVQDVVALKEKLIKNVKGAPVHHIGFVKINGRKRVCKLWWSEEVRGEQKE